MQCRYDQINKAALEDAELYEKTGKVRSPSPVILSDSEEDTKPVLKGVCEISKRATEPASVKPDVVANTVEERGEGCSTPAPQQSQEERSVTSDDPDTDIESHPSDTEYDPDKTTESSASQENSPEEQDESTDEEDESTEEEVYPATSEVPCNPKS